MLKREHMLTFVKWFIIINVIVFLSIRLVNNIDECSALNAKALELLEAEIQYYHVATEELRLNIEDRVLNDYEANGRGTQDFIP